MNGPQRPAELARLLRALASVLTELSAYLDSASGGDASTMPTTVPATSVTPKEHWLTTNEAAAYLGIKPSSMRALVARGKVKPDHRGGSGGEGLKSHRFHLDTLNAFLGRPHPAMTTGKRGQKVRG